MILDHISDLQRQLENAMAEHAAIKTQQIQAKSDCNWKLFSECSTKMGETNRRVMMLQNRLRMALSAAGHEPPNLYDNCHQ